MFIKRCPAHFSQNLGFCTWNILVYEHFTLWMWFKVKLMRHNGRTTGKWLLLYAASIMLPKTTPKYQYPPFPLLSYFSVGVCLRCLLLIVFCYLLYIHSGKTGNLFSLLLCSLWWVQIVGYVLVWISYSFVCTLHHLIIIIVQTYLKTLKL